MVNDDMQELFEGYLVESTELLDSISQDLMEIENDRDNPDLINQLFRSFHTIKGTSGFMGFDHISGLTHEAEDLLNKVRRGELTITNEIADVLLRVRDIIEDMIEKIKDGDETKPDVTEIITEIKKLRGEDTSSTPDQTPSVEETPSEETETTPSIDLSGEALDDVLNDPTITQGDGDFSDDELERLQAAFSEINAGFAAEDSPETEEKTETEDVEEETPESTPEPVTPSTTKSKEPVAPKKPAKTNETIRIDVNRIEILMDLSGELVLGRNRLAQLVEQMGGNKEEHITIERELQETTSQIDFVTSEIQSAVMKMRMVPVGKLYQKAPRIVRELARDSGKKINLVVKGEETEIDRGIIEELNDPLVHMIRNSCDHGIESPADRINKGKSEVGTVTLDADQEGNHIVLRIIDDGAGMNPEVLKKKALEKGVITQDQYNSMSDREAYHLIFAPGFSTAKQVTDVSGRGVGMDVVKTNIQKLKGMVEIDSEMGKGTTFSIKLPLTLAIIQGLLVMVEDETYAIPLSSVEEVVSLEESEISTINSQEVIRIRENVYPIMRLNSVLGLEDTGDPEDKNVVLVGVGIERIGLVVDKLLGQQEIVIKSLGKYLGSVKGLAGSTILGDGRVIMIIDVAEMVQEFYAKNK